MLKPGDKVALSLNISVEIAKYKSVKPHASLTRVFPEGADEETFLSECETALRRMVMRGVLMQLDVENDLYDALGAEPDVENLAKFCKKELGYVAQRPHVEIEGGTEAGASAGVGRGADAQSAARKKGPVKKG